ncbi:MAG: response regulator [Fibrobacteria bacterium]
MLHPILLVEDNPMDVDLTKRAFVKRKLANPLEIARDGEEALTWIAKWDAGQKRPLVILLDLNLPKLSGIEVLRILKNHPVYKTIPVVILTTSKEDKDLHEAYVNGVNSYIVKPVSFENFMDVAEHIQLYWGVLNMMEAGAGT